MTAYDDYMRTIIDIPEDILQSLDRVRVREQRSRASLIREALSDFVRGKSAAPAEEAFGMWKRKAEDGVHYQERLRDEWSTR